MESQSTAGTVLPFFFGVATSSGPMEFQPTAGAVLPCAGSRFVILLAFFPLPTTLAGVADLVDAVALGAAVLWTCRFESCPRYHFLVATQRG